MSDEFPISPPSCLIPIGTLVRVGGDIPGRIATLTGAAGKVRYEITWWSGRERRQEWFETFEFTVDRLPVVWAIRPEEARQPC